MLETIVGQPLAWDNTLRWDQQIIQLPAPVIDELHSIECEFDPYNPDCDFTALRTSGAIDKLAQTVEHSKPSIDGAPGFALINFQEDMPRAYYDKALVFVSLLLGNYLEVQDSSGIKVKEIRDRGKRYGVGTDVRYSETNTGGNLHVDGVERPGKLPDYLAFLIIRQSESGGDSLMVSPYAIHDWFLEHDRESLECLYGDFSWDRRGKLGPNGEETFQAPIFSYNHDTSQLNIRYLRQYIDDGHRKSGIELNRAQQEVLAQLDALLAEDSGLVLKGRIPPGHLLISNNPQSIHGRNDFKDYMIGNQPDPERSRQGIRTWVYKEKPI